MKSMVMKRMPCADPRSKMRTMLCQLPRPNQFLLEALQHLGIAREFRTDHFERNSAVKFAVVGTIDRAHGPFAKESNDFVAAGQNGARLQGLQRAGFGFP